MAIERVYRCGRGLHPFSSSFGPGLTVVAGPNGSGKTTLLRMLATTLHPRSGELRWCEQLVARDPIPYRRTLGYLPQAFAVYGSWRMAEFLAYVARLKGLPPNEIPARVETSLQTVQLEGLGNRPVRSAAHGELRRLGIAQALLAQPRVLILDEPFAGLSPENRARLLPMLALYARTNLVLLSTHLLDGLATHAGRLLILRDGSCLADAAPGELLEDAHIEISPTGEPGPGVSADRALEAAYRHVLSLA